MAVNPISALNNKKNGLRYETIDQWGPPHDRSFKVRVRVFQETFYGIGKSKKSAQYAAASRALQSIQSPDCNKEINDEEIQVNENNPVYELSILKKNVTYEVIEQTGPPHNPVFNICIDIDGKKFYGKGNSKKSAQSEAATNALAFIKSTKGNDIQLKPIQKTIPTTLVNSQNNPVALLNTFKNGLVYELVEQSGPPHKPSFKMCVTINDKKFYGTGDTKNAAKHMAADEALKCIKNIDTTIECSVPTEKDSKPLNVITNIAKNPISILNEINNTLKYDLVDEWGPCHKKSFKMCVVLNGKNYYGIGSTKQAAKCNTAIEALKSMGLYENNDVNSLNQSGNTDQTTSEVIRSTEQLRILSESNNTKREPCMKKNPIAALNELRNGLNYKLVEISGSDHNPLFKICVNVDNENFFGTGSSKQAAKFNAASNALNSLISNQEKPDSDIKNTLYKGPLTLLQELYPEARFTCGVNENSIVARFQVNVRVNDENFIGAGSSKKSAKEAAAASALSKLINYVSPHLPFFSSHDEISSDIKQQQQMADHIGQLINSKFNHLLANDAVLSKRNVLAGFAMTRNSDTSTPTTELICFTTGSKCISGDHISDDGSSLNDLHAEVLSRRCLKNFFYDQLELMLRGKESIFRPKDDADGYELKPGIEFHLYVNKVPCGDASFSAATSGRGVLRTKLEAGQGTVPVQLSLQTWDGILAGDRLLTMSCSDKICKWNVLGLQGALLSHYIDPVYLKSLIIGSEFGSDNVRRAICGRIEAMLPDLPPSFSPNNPNVFRLTSIENRVPQNPPSFSVVWTSNVDTPEMIISATGKPKEGTSSVCKRNLANRFVTLFGKLSTSTGIDSLPETLQQLKEKAAGYKAAKEALYESFAKAQLGTWVSKPIEQDMFQIKPKK